MSGAVKITGATRLYAIVGDPIAQVRSPEVFTERFASMGIDALLVPVHVPTDRFDDVIPALLALGNLDGLLVTVPFKARMVDFTDRLGETARCIGALNAMRREVDGSWTGDMFDGAGFLRGARHKGQRVRGRRVVLFGAGGAGSAIACALAGADVRSIHVIDTVAARADELVSRLRPTFPKCVFEAATEKPADADMVVNASPVGMRPGDGLPGDIGPLPADTLVGDVVIVDAPTPLIQHAIRHGCNWVDGRDMHAGQVEAVLRFLTSPLSFSDARPTPSGVAADTHHDDHPNGPRTS